MNKKLTRLHNILNLPPAAIFDEHRIEINGNSEIDIDCVEKVLKYDENVIKLAAKKRDILIFGKDLSLQFVRTDALVVNGEISSIEFRETQPQKR